MCAKDMLNKSKVIPIVPENINSEAVSSILSLFGHRMYSSALSVNILQADLHMWCALPFKLKICLSKAKTCHNIGQGYLGGTKTIGNLLKRFLIAKPP